MDNRYAIGIDIGGTNIRAAIVSNKGEIIKKIKEKSSGDIIPKIYKTIEDLFSENLIGIGFAIAGLIDYQRGFVLISPNLPAIEGEDFVYNLSAKFNVPVIIENDANAAAHGELFAGIGRNFSDFVLLTLGTGIGGGIIYNRKLMNVSAEIGHMSINAEGNKCLCGNYGCLESYASATAIISSAISLLENGRKSILRERITDYKKITAKEIFQAAEEGDLLSIEVLKNAGKFLGIGISNIINILSPQAVILTGGLIGAWDIYVKEAINVASQRAFNHLFKRTKIIKSELMDNAGIIGAAGLLFKR